MKYLFFFVLFISSCGARVHKYHIHIENLSSETSSVVIKEAVSLGDDLNKEISLQAGQSSTLYLGEQKIGSYGELSKGKIEVVYCKVIFDLDETFEKTLCQEDIDRHTTYYYIYDEGEDCLKGEKIYY